MVEWLNQNGGAGQVILLAVQVLVTVVLVGVTFSYTRAKKRMATATVAVATATDQTTVEAKREHLDATLPVVALRLKDCSGHPFDVEFVIEAANIGLGPALNVLVRLGDKESKLAAIGAGGATSFTYKVPLAHAEFTGGAVQADRADVHQRHFRSEKVLGFISGNAHLGELILTLPAH